ncbi:MAG: DUF5009 domain-containing protein [Verrucomicrobiota bacterium]
MSTSPSKASRLISLDIFRGIDIFLMVLVNGIAGMKGIPFMLRHAGAWDGVITIPDFVFPAFLFIMGVGIPFAFHKKFIEEKNNWAAVRYILERSFGLMVIGVMLVNREFFSEEYTGMSRSLWYFFLYLSIFMIWTDFSPLLEQRARGWSCLIKGIGLLGVAFLLWRFRGLDSGKVVWMQLSWWGILGVLGWCYLICSFCYLFGRGNLVFLGGMFFLMIALYIWTRSESFHGGHWMNSVVDIGGVWGSRSSITMTGVIAGTFLLKNPGNVRKLVLWGLLLGLYLVFEGFLLRPLHGFSKIRGTESFTLVASGVSLLCLLILYILVDVKGCRSFFIYFLPIGVNPLAAYLFPDFLNTFLEILHLKKYFWCFWSLGGWWGGVNALGLTLLALYGVSAMTRRKIFLKV